MSARGARGPGEPSPPPRRPPRRARAPPGAPRDGRELPGDTRGGVGLEPPEQVADGRLRGGATDLEPVDDPGLDADRVAVGLAACVVQRGPVIHGRWWCGWGGGRGVPGQYDSRAKRQGSAPPPADAP